MLPLGTCAVAILAQVPTLAISLWMAISLCVAAPLVLHEVSPQFCGPVAIFDEKGWDLRGLLLIAAVSICRPPRSAV